MTVLSNIQEEVLLGTLLGDGHLEKNGRFVRLKIDHSIKQKDYVFYKYHVFSNLASSKPKEISVFDRRTSRIYKHIRFNTRSIPELLSFWELFYQSKKKKVPKEILQLFDSPLSLAIWYMDDGARRTDCNALRIHSTAYSINENELLLDMLNKNFMVNSKIHKVVGNSYVLYIPVNEAQRFCNLIRPYVIPSLRYKLL